MSNMLAALAGALISAVSLMPAALAQPACVTQNMVVPPGANTTDKAAPFFIDTTGLDFKTTPPTRDPSNPNYPRATELPDGTLPPAGAEGNFIIGPTHAPAPETVAKDGVPRGTITSFTMSSKDSVIYNPGLIRDDAPGCSNSSIMIDDDGAGRQVEHDRHHQPSRHLDAHDRGLCARRTTCAAPRCRSSCWATAARLPGRT